ncbi:MAG TPA: RsmE family RNA methyltransferase [Balneolales bacterium]|nr:RsmE family RNA methyltransferase [Balneolales bacterium]
MNVFYAPPNQISGDYIEINGDEAHHISRVLRYKTGQEITVVDGVGNKYSGLIEIVRKKQVQVRITDKKTLMDPQKTPKRLILGLGIIKHRQRLEFAIEKAIELGATDIVLFKSRYTEKDNVRTDRIENIMISAMKQSMHAMLPVLTIAQSLEEAISKYPQSRIIIAHEKHDGKPGIMNEIKEEKEVLALIGPEGGFSEEEVNMVREKGGEVVSLGRYRLRAETAAIAILSLFLG